MSGAHPPAGYAFLTAQAEAAAWAIRLAEPHGDLRLLAILDREMEQAGEQLGNQQ